MEANGIWRELFKVGAYMVDQDQKLSLPMMCNLFQEVAGNHANFRNLGFYEMKAQNRFWVLNRIKIGVSEYPKWQDEIEVLTWVSMMRGPFSNRHFALYKNGKELASSFSFWVAIDADTHRPVRVNADGVVILEGQEASCGQAEKLAPFSGGEIIGSYKVQRSDIDMLGHVNNVKYTEWLLNQRMFDPSIKNIQINYLQEAKLGDEVSFYKQGEQVALRNKNTDQILTLFKV